MDTLDPTDNRPRYQQVADAVERAITTGEFAVGDRLPGRGELSRYFDVSPMTIVNACRLLARRGLVRTRDGVGTFVAASGCDDEVNVLRARVDELEDQLRQLAARIPA